MKISIITSKSEAKECIPSGEYKDLCTIFDKPKILFIDNMKASDFKALEEYDFVIVKTRDIGAIKRLEKYGIKSSAESMTALSFNLDKTKIKKINIESQYIHVPLETQHPETGVVYFVKPKFGENSNHIDSGSICYNRVDAMLRMRYLQRLGIEPLCEEYIDGLDATVACYYDESKQLHICPIVIGSPDGILTKETKDGDRETYASLPDEYLEPVQNAMRELVKVVDCKRMCRVDMRIRKSDGVPFVIEVNLYAGLSKRGYLYECLRICEGKTYEEAIKAVLNSSRD